MTLHLHNPDANRRPTEMPFAELVEQLTLQYVTPSHNGQVPTIDNTQIIRTNACRRTDVHGKAVSISRVGQLQLLGYQLSAKRVHQALLTGAWPAEAPRIRTRTNEG